MERYTVLLLKNAMFAQNIANNIDVTVQKSTPFIPNEIYTSLVRTY